MRRAPIPSFGPTLAACAVAASLAACSLVSLDGLTGSSDDAGVHGGSGSSSGAPIPEGGSTSSGSGSSSGGSSGGASSSSSGSSGTSSNGGDSSSGGAPDASGPGEPEAGADAGPPHEASVESSAPDTGPPPPEAGPKDSGAPETAPPLGFCASLNPAPLFCDDFDEGTALATPWDMLASTNGAEVASAASYVSPPDSMLVTVNPNTADTAVDDAGYKSFPSKQGVAGTATMSFEMRVDAVDESATSDGILGAIQLWNGSTYWDLELEVFYEAATNDLEVSMSEDGNTVSYVQHFASTHLPLGTWTQVTLAIALPAGTNGAAPATLAFNGTTVASATVTVGTPTPIPEILVGTTYATPCAGGWSLAYDDVTFDDK